MTETQYGNVTELPSNYFAFSSKLSTFLTRAARATATRCEERPCVWLVVEERGLRAAVRRRGLLSARG